MIRTLIAPFVGGFVCWIDSLLIIIQEMAGTAVNQTTFLALLCDSKTIVLFSAILSNNKNDKVE